MTKNILFWGLSIVFFVILSLTSPVSGVFTYRPPFSPINFLISPDGISYEYDPSIHTFIGDFGYEYQAPVEPENSRFLYVTIYNDHWAETQKNKVFKLDLQHETVEIWLNDRPLVARIFVSSNGLRIENNGVQYIKYDGRMLRIDVSDGTINKVSFHSEPGMMGRIVGPEFERNKFCRASMDRKHIVPVMMLVCLGDFTEMILGVIPRFLTLVFGDIGGAIIGFWTEIGLLAAIIWYIGKNSKPKAYIALSLLFIWLLLGMLRVWPDILF